jgi:geranylgeranyl reductase family protein
MADALDVAIVGAGPAGAYCALQLAEEGIKATIFDHSHPREKPCGGGLSAEVVEKFSFVNKYRSRGSSSDKFKILSCTGREVAAGIRKGFNISRRFFDYEIVKAAVEKGANLVPEKVMAIGHKHDIWRIKTDKQTVTTNILVGADGVSSLVRQSTVGNFSRENLQLTYGYFVSGVESEPTTIKFLAEIPGCIWLFPRNGYSSLGIGGPLRYGSWLKKLLDRFLESYCSSLNILSAFAALIPCAENPNFFDLNCAGKNWVLVGDAAGHVDPITGEGILYALWSGKLAAEAIANHDLESYDVSWRNEYGDYLKTRVQKRDVFYDPLRIELMIFQTAL